MTNHKYILTIFIFFLSFFVFNNVVLAENDVMECAYTSMINSNYKFNFNLGKEKPHFTDNQGNYYNFYSYVDNKNFGDPYVEYTACPKYLVNFSQDSGIPTSTTEYYVFKKEPSNEIISKATSVFKLNEANGGVSGATGDDKSHNCIYNQYLYYNNTKSWVITYDINSTMIYTSDTANFKNGLSSIRFQFPNDDRTYHYGNNSAIKASDLRENSCPEYLLYTNVFTTDYVDGYDTDKTIDDMKAMARNANNVFYVKTDAQREIDKKTTLKNTCAYYRGDNKMSIEFIKGFNATDTSNLIYYDINITYYEGLNSNDGIKYTGTIRNFDSNIFNTIIDNNDCSTYPYIFVDDKNDGYSTIDFSFYKKVTDVKKSFLYYKIATSRDDARTYKKQVTDAYSLIQDLVGQLQSYNNGEISLSRRDTEITRLFASAANVDNAPEDVQNVVTYLNTGGKINKAIYDYTSYWYAQATNYASLFVVDEDLTGGSLKETSNELIEYIKKNVKAGYIPIPDGCQMLSQDLVDFLAWGLRIVRYGAVLITIILGMIDFFRAMAESDDKAFQKAGGRFLKRIVAVVLIFLSALFIQFILYNYALPGIGEDEINLCNITNSK